MLDKFDYAEPRCPLSGGRDFYYPESDAPRGTVPVKRIIERTDALLAKNNTGEAERLLLYWLDEAKELLDKRGELSLLEELIGFYRKAGNKEKGLRSLENALRLTEELSLSDTVSGATVFLNAATAYKEFGMAEEALDLYLRAEEIYHCRLSGEDSRLAALYNNMAVTLAALGKFSEAEDRFFSALGIMSKRDGGEGECAMTYINMAYMYEATDRLDTSLECMRLAHALLCSERVVRDGSFAFVLKKCAPAFEHFGDSITSEKMIKEAEKIYEGA